MKLSEPYWAITEGLPGLDFNREFIDPGTDETFPEGAVGIRVDGAFWAVAALPWKYRDMPLSAIVRELWPQYADQAELCPDGGSAEQKLYFAREGQKHAERLNKHLQDELHKARDEIARMKIRKPDYRPRQLTRVEGLNNYFVRQYEHLLIAMAHENQLREDKPGICKVCGLYGTDRIHMQHYIDLNKAGYEPDVASLPMLPNAESEDE